MSKFKNTVSTVLYIVAGFMSMGWLIAESFDPLMIDAKAAGDLGELQRLAAGRFQAIMFSMLFIFVSAYVHRFRAPKNMKLHEIAVTGFLTTVFTFGMGMTVGAIANAVSSPDKVIPIGFVAALIGWWLGYGWFAEWFQRLKANLNSN